MKSVFSWSRFLKSISLIKTLPWVGEVRIKAFFNIPIIPSLFYITPNANWSTDWDAYYITRCIRKHGLSTQISTTPQLLSKGIIHYSDLGTYIHYINGSWNERNQVVMTFFHGDRSGRYTEFIPLIDSFLNHLNTPKAIVTSCNIMKNRLIEWGIEQERVKCIPLGIDLAHFQPASPERKKIIRESLNIPSDTLCIGSFQKDGVGWKEGIDPKLVKGPDIFLRVIQKLKSHYKIFVLLSGPARGYIKNGLESLDVPYRHLHLKNYWEIVRLYHALDLYLVTSREEGGPKAMLESLACGIPLVTTRVGMVPDVIIDKYNGLSVENEDIDGLVQSIIELQENPQLVETITTNGLTTVKDYQWSIIAKKYYDEVYAPLLNL